MKKQSTKELYGSLIQKKYNNSAKRFLIDIKDSNHLFWECCRDTSRELMMSSSEWRWLGYRIDDYARLVEVDVVNKLNKWLEKGSLSKIKNDLYAVIKWLFDRYANNLRNLFDKRSKKSLDPSYIINFHDMYTY